METIKNYLDNMFAGLPKTSRVNDLKNNMLSNMEEKYNELKRQGKSENEAIGIVISEFGNIDELMNELGIQKDVQVSSLPSITEEEAETYMSAKRKMGLQVGIGVILCILSPAVLILIDKLIEDGLLGSNMSESYQILGVIALLVIVAVAVGIFIYSGMNFERYKYIEDGVQIPGSLETSLKQKYDRFTPKFYLSLIIGVGMIIISPVTIFVASLIDEADTVYGVVILLAIVAAAVFLFIYTGIIRESYERLLKIGEYTPKKKKEDKIIGAVAAVIWPLATIIFFYNGFVNGAWGTAWLVFPITGILFGMFSAVYSILTSKNE
jgi:hypothetical protein